MTGEWNYRVTVTREDDGLGGTEEVFSIREVYYDDEGKADAWSTDGHAVSGDSWESLTDELALMAAAIRKPLLYLTGGQPVESTVIP